jgi:hypothetical protein
MKKYQELAGRFTAYKNCLKSNNKEWEEKHYSKIEEIINSLPHGSGIDGKTEFDFDNSKSDKLIINSSYHAMDENGFYDRWIDFSLIITPSLQFGFNLTITGKFGRNQEIKEYLLDIFHSALDLEILSQIK